MSVVRSEKEEQLQLKMRELEIAESDLREHFIRGSGSGGQKVQKTSSCVQLQHIPTGIEVRCEKTRSQSLNRYYARVLLCEKIAERLHGEKSKRQQEREKLRVSARLCSLGRELS